MFAVRKICLDPSGTPLPVVDLQLDSAPYLGTFTLKKSRAARDPGDLVCVLSSRLLALSAFVLTEPCMQVFISG